MAMVMKCDKCGRLGEKLESFAFPVVNRKTLLIMAVDDKTRQQGSQTFRDLCKPCKEEASKLLVKFFGVTAILNTEQEPKGPKG